MPHNGGLLYNPTGLQGGWPYNDTIVSGWYSVFLHTYSYFSLSIETETSVNLNQDHTFTYSSDEHKLWAMEGAKQLCDFMAKEGK